MLIGCGKKSDSTDKLENAILCVQNANSLESIEKCYTNSTIRVAKNLLSRKLITQEQIFSILKFTDKGDTWTNVQEKIDNNRATISIKFLKHSRENMRAFQLDLKAKHETGLWKLDMSDSFQIDDESRGIKKYLLDKFKNY